MRSFTGSGRCEGRRKLARRSTLLPVDEDAVFSAARLKIAHRLSYADAFAIAAAIAKNATLLTGGPEIRSLPGVIPLAPLHHTVTLALSPRLEAAATPGV